MVTSRVAIAIVALLALGMGSGYTDDSVERAHCEDKISDASKIQVCVTAFKQCLQIVAAAIEAEGGPVTNAIFNICDEQIGPRPNAPRSTSSPTNYSR